MIPTFNIGSISSPTNTLNNQFFFHGSNVGKCSVRPIPVPKVKMKNRTLASRTSCNAPLLGSLGGWLEAEKETVGG